MFDVSVVLPTYNRVGVLMEGLRRLDSQAAAPLFEVIVVDDGSSDSTIEVARAYGEDAGYDLRVLSQANAGPAAARNKGIDAARSPVCLFIGDDTWATPLLVARHARYHRLRPEREAALLGRTEWAEEVGPTAFMVWASRVHEAFAEIDDPTRVPGRFFFTGNVSVKTSFLRSVDGFHAGFPYAAFEDIDLGLRLERAGMKLTYDQEAVVGHYHPMGLTSEVARMRTVAVSAQILAQRFPNWPEPRKPGFRHRVKAAALWSIARTSRTRGWQREEVWRFLCHEAYREAYWGYCAQPPRRLRIGERLLQLVEDEADAAEPPVALA